MMRVVVRPRRRLPRRKRLAVAAVKRVCPADRPIRLIEDRKGAAIVAIAAIDAVAAA